MEKKRFNNFNKARDLGSLDGTRSIKGTTTRADKVDFFELELSGRSSFSLEPQRVQSNLNIQLFDGDRARLAKTKFKAKGKKRSLEQNELEAGTYYIQVKGRTKSGKDRFKLRLESNVIGVIDDPGIPDAPSNPSTPANPIDPDGTREVGVLSGTYANTDLVGVDDPLDLYRFQLEEASTFDAQLSGFSQTVGLGLFRDANSNGAIEDTEAVVFTSGAPIDLEAGSYFIRVNGSAISGNSNYTLTLTQAPITDGGDVDIGALTGTYTNSDVIGGDDEQDVYLFRLDQISTFTAQLSGLSQAVDFGLFYDSNDNGVFEESAYVSGRTISSATLTDNLPAGNYAAVIRNGAFGPEESNYNFTLIQTDNPGNLASDPGDSVSNAFNVGVLSGQQRLVDLVGKLDAADYYTFTINEVSDIFVQIEGLSQSTRLSLFSDSDNNGVFESLGFNVSTSRISLSGESLPAGQYLVTINNQSLVDNNTRYELTLNQTPSSPIA